MFPATSKASANTQVLLDTVGKFLFIFPLMDSDLLL